MKKGLRQEKVHARQAPCTSETFPDEEGIKTFSSSLSSSKYSRKHSLMKKGLRLPNGGEVIQRHGVGNIP